MLPISLGNIIIIIKGVIITFDLFRHAALRAGCDVSIPALTVNRLCGSGFEAVAQVATEIELGKATIGIAGGAESMSQVEFDNNSKYKNCLGSICSSWCSIRNQTRN